MFIKNIYLPSISPASPAPLPSHTDVLYRLFTIRSTVKEFGLQNAITTHYATRRQLGRSPQVLLRAVGDEVTSKERLSRGNFTLAFVGYGDESDHVLELTYNWDVEKLGLLMAILCLGRDCCLWR